VNIGGKVEPGECSKDAMIREAFEETDLDLKNSNFVLFL
jgi:8-oxo-dGTP pyrophosphatase MutT (NUDIX family)